MIEVDRKLTMAPLAAAIQSIPFNHKPSFLLILLTLSTFPVRGNRKIPEKTHDYRKSRRTLPTCNQIFDACSYMFAAGFEPLTSETISVAVDTVYNNN